MQEKKNTLLELKQTCYACPSQWGGKILTPKGVRPIYIGYRWGYLSIRVGKLNSHIDSAIFGIEIFGDQIGNFLDGLLTEEELQPYLEKALEVDIEALFDKRIERGLKCK